MMGTARRLRRVVGGLDRGAIRLRLVRDDFPANEAAGVRYAVGAHFEHGGVDRLRNQRAALLTLRHEDLPDGTRELLQVRDLESRLPDFVEVRTVYGAEFQQRGTDEDTEAALVHDDVDRTDRDFVLREPGDRRDLAVRRNRLDLRFVRHSESPRPPAMLSEFGARGVECPHVLDQQSTVPAQHLEGSRRRTRQLGEVHVGAHGRPSGVRRPCELHGEPQRLALYREPPSVAQCDSHAAIVPAAGVMAMPYSSFGVSTSTFTHATPYATSGLSSDLAAAAERARTRSRCS